MLPEMFQSETGFVRWLLKRVPGKARGLKLGIGDDAALVGVESGQGVILKSDMSIENVHFKRRLHPPRSVGHRALARPLSDVAAMGATPRFALVSLALSRRTPPGWTRELYAGLLALAARFGVTLVGGDVAVVSGRTLIDVIVTGEVAPGRELRRSGAKPGDRIFVSGELGLAALGLRLLHSQGRLPRARQLKSESDGRSRVTALQAHLYPEPRCMLGHFLSIRSLASASIDLSDGLSTDLHHLCEASGVGARVWEELLPLPQAPQYAHRTLLRLALHGGEDYQLLFTVPRGKKIPSSLGGLPLRRIGEIQGTREILLLAKDGRSSPLRPEGYDHFRHWRSNVS
jgi:thiamine-monophosphate kinase